MKPKNNSLHSHADLISQSGLSIYDPVLGDHPHLWVPDSDLETLLNSALIGRSLHDLPLRSRSRKIKELVCRALGYPVPGKFKKTSPRFPGQMLDTYGQKANNLQIWNEDVDSSRRYAIIRIGDNDKILKVKVVRGDRLEQLDTTGTLTQKHQARLELREDTAELVSADDTDLLKPFTRQAINLEPLQDPSSDPCIGQLLSIRGIFEMLLPLIGKEFKDPGHDQDRSRGAMLHKSVCERLGYEIYREDGRFPDIRHQLVEVKLQTSPTIDLGLVTPDSDEALGISINGHSQIRHCDVRYVIFHGETDGDAIRLTHLFLTTGERFFTRFPQFLGDVLNKKLQITLPQDFFDD